MKILVSACLLGLKCRYDGNDGYCEAVAALARNHQLVPACPELLGGLPVPREPAELSGGRVVTKGGRDVTAQFEKGAAETLKLAQEERCACAILKSRSPSCGAGKVYDGTFTGTLTNGDGVAAKILRENGVTVLCDENSLPF